MRTRTVVIPRDLAIVFDSQGWHFAEPGEIPPGWFLDLLDPEVADAPERSAEPVEVPILLRTSCRPGRGPCRRRHEHASWRRVA